MLSGPELGKAVAEAIRLKGLPKTAVAKHFGIQGPSIYDWIKHGRVGKQHLTALFDYFSDVVGPEHWGLLPDDGLVSQAQRLEPGIILRAIQLMREATRQVEGRAIDVEADPELFAAMLQLAVLESMEGGDGERDIREAVGQGGRAAGAAGEAEARTASGTSGRRIRKRA